MVEIETRCRIPIGPMADVWANSITCHPTAACTIEGCCHLANQCHDPRATYHIAGCCNRRPGEFNGMSSQSHVSHWLAGCCHLVNSLSWFQIRMQQCRVQSPGEINVIIVFRRILFFCFCFKCSLGFDERRLSYRLRYTCLTWSCCLVLWHRIKIFPYGSAAGVTRPDFYWLSEAHLRLATYTCFY